MSLRSPRQRMALLVVLVAGLAALATQPAPFRIDRFVEGQVELHEVARVSGRIRLGPAVEPVTGGELSLTVAQRANRPTQSGIEARLTFVESGAVARDWSRLPFSVHADRSRCSADTPCEVPFLLELRTIPPLQGPLVVRWRISAVLVANYRAGMPREMELEVEAPPAPPSLPLLALAATLGGAAAGFVVVLLGRRITDRRRRLTALEAAASVALLLIGLVRLHGWLAQGMSLVPALAWLLLGGVALGYALLRSNGAVAAYLVVVGLLGLPITLMLTSMEAAHRVVDVAVTMGGLGATGVIGMAAFVQAAGRERVVEWSRLSTRSRVTLSAGVLVVVLLAVWAAVLAADLTRYLPWYALWPAFMLPLVVRAIWRWLTGRHGSLRSMGRWLIPFAIVGALVAFLTFFEILYGTQPRAMPPAVLSSVVIAVCGLVLAIGGPPRASDGRTWLAPPD